MTYTIMNADELADVSSLDVAMNLMNLGRWEAALDWAVCARMVIAAGLPVPIKSACYFCPASKPWEVMWLAAEHPDLALRAVQMEDRYRSGRHYRSDAKTHGLWHDRTWRTYLEDAGVLEGDAIDSEAARRQLDVPDHAGTVQLTVRRTG